MTYGNWTTPTIDSACWTTYTNTPIAGALGWHSASTLALFCPSPSEPKSEPKKEKKRMSIYIIFLVDAVENDILFGPLYGIGKDEASAAAGINLTKDQKKSISKGDFILVTKSIASYEPVEISYVRSK
jgi:hypothetical protein